ncbi:hypothetical protein AWM68_14590 [Fictibacillus phosphorivorans]|uniref:Uncharacterized protein n=1 Tax=Fictibacillus phosphorivorans TaxID=1221500 RepID=A0A163PYE9_9BACL|nr:hypothetical protein [Fictibacillus phosphorivorans]KZE64313.1 hypothetical protein AWM68_14590 [Fictibacillus phosphorivorans]
MIKTLIKSHVNMFLSKKLMFVLLIYILYTFYLKNIAIYYQLTYFEFTINALTDHYYILYCMIISFIFLLLNINNPNEECVWIRSGTFFNYFLSKIAAVVVNSILFVFLHILIALLMGFGLDFENKYTFIESNNLFILEKLEAIFSTPLESILPIVGYMIGGLTLLGIFLLFIRHFLKPGYVIGIIVVLYLMMLVGLRSDLDAEVPYLFLNNYVIFHHALAAAEERFYIFIFLGLLYIGFILWFTKKYWCKSFSFQLLDPLSKWNLSILFKKSNLFTIILLLCFIVISIAFTYKDITFKDLLTLVYFGHGTGYLRMLDFLRLIIYNGIPIYLLSIFLEKESLDKSIMVVIRLKKMKNWLFCILKSATLFIVSYICISLTIIILVSAFMGLPFNGYEYMKPFINDNGIGNLDTGYLLLIIISTKFLELLFSFLVIVTLFSLTKTSITGFIVIVSAYLIGLLKIAYLKYSPIGLSSLVRITEVFGEDQSLPYFVSFLILLISNVLLYAVLKSGLYKKSFSKG